MKFYKKKEMIHDGGVHEKGNHVNIIIFCGCLFVTVFLLYLGIMAYVAA